MNRYIDWALLSCFPFAASQYVSIREGVRRRTLELGEDAQAVPITVRQLEVGLGGGVCPSYPVRRSREWSVERKEKGGVRNDPRGFSLHGNARAEPVPKAYFLLR